MQAKVVHGRMSCGSDRTGPAHFGCRATSAAWHDNANGLALGGYEPVAYHVDAAARRGMRDQEYAWRDAVFRFVNEGNLGAFKRNAQVYAPRFAGHDVFDLAQGPMVEGQPEIWAIRDSALYLFDSVENHNRWARDPEVVLARAAEQWKRISETIPELSGN